MSRAILDLKQQFLEYVEIERGRALKTVENYDRYLSRFITYANPKSPEDITEAMVREFRLWLNRQPDARLSKAAHDPLKRKTQNYYLIALRSFLKFLQKRGITTLSPEKIELAKVPERSLDLITTAELNRLVASPEGKDIRAKRDRAILELLFSTGLRVSELCALDRDIDLASDELSVRGKGEKVRVVFLSDKAKRAVAEYLALRTDTEDALFIGIARKKNAESSGPLTPRSVERLVKQYAIRAGITRKVTPHVIRHSFATDLLQNGADLRSVQALLGHANIATTQVYTHVTDAHLREVHRKYHGKRR